MTKQSFYWVLQIIGWSAYAVLNILFLLLADSPEFFKITSLILTALWFLLSTHLFRSYIKKHNWLKISLTGLLPRILLASFLLGVSNYVFYVICLIAFNIINYSNDFSPFSILAYVFSTMVFYLLWTLVYFIYHIVDSYNKSLKYEAAINEIELNKLKSQLNPHFIFNALNSIRALVDEDPIKSKKAITQLSSILRSSLIMNKNKLTYFKDELEAVKDYLDLESIRLEERLKTHFDIDESSENFKIPPLMLQTLVENGIKHGISHIKEGGEISIMTKVIDSKMHITIKNSGHYINGKKKEGRGFGIDNTIQRLNLIYGDHATFNIQNGKNNTVLTELVIPQTI